MSKAPGYEVEISGAPLGRQRRHRIVRAVLATLEREGCTRAAVSVAVVNDATIATLHVRFMDTAGPTDVLSFDLRDDARSVREGYVEGEVVVSRETARREAKRRKLPVEQELLRYVIHGVLHLAGYLDDNPARAKRMHRIEDEVLNTCGMPSSR